MVGCLKALDLKQWQITNITKLRVGMEDDFLVNIKCVYKYHYETHRVSYWRI